MKYDVEKKAKAIARMSEIGVAKTSEEMNISVQTLYKWRSESQTDDVATTPAQPNNDLNGLLQVIHSEERQAAAIKRLEEENCKLREENAKLLQENTKLKIVVKAFIG